MEVQTMIEDLVQRKASYQANRGRPVTQKQITEIVKKILDRADARAASGAPPLNLSAMLRGMKVLKGEAVAPSTAEADLRVLKALDPGSNPGAYLVETTTAEVIGAYASLGGALDAAGPRIIPMPNVLKKTLVLPSIPDFQWLGASSQISAADPVVGQVTANLKFRKALVEVSNELMATSNPAVDEYLAEIFGVAAGESTDQYVFSASDVAGAPKCLFTTPTVTRVLVGANPNGGALAYSDIFAMIDAAHANGCHMPWCFFCSPRTFDRIFELATSTSMPFLTPRALQTGPSAWSLFDIPLYVSPAIPEDLITGSNTDTSYMVLADPKFFNLFRGGFELSISTERLFDANASLVRCTAHEDISYFPPEAIIVLEGVL